jgi:MFS transporter, DHA2 family, methylenomycin A resistance protein
MSSRRSLTLLTTCLGLFLVQLDTTAVNLALPAIADELHGSVATLQWVVDSYNLAFAALLLTGGVLGDRFGRRLLFVIGIGGFVTGSLVCALAPTSAALVGGRVVQGLGAALAIPQTLALLADAYPERSERNRAMAGWAAAAGIALAAGPTLGGLLVDTVGWQAIFWLNVPLGLGTLAMAALVVRESTEPHARPLDPAGQVLAAGFLASLTFVVVDGRLRGWDSSLILATTGAALACLVGFIVVERRQREPMLPVSLLRHGPLPVAAVVAACMTFGMYGLLFLASLDLQRQRGTSALAAGLQLLPLPIVFIAVSPFVAGVVTRIGPRLPMTAGMALMGSGLLAFAALGGDTNIGALEVVLAVIGLGLALNTGPVAGVAVSALERSRAGLASGVANLARMLGAALGVAALGTVLAAFGGGTEHGPPFLAGLRVALMVGGAVELCGAVVAGLLVRDAQQEAHAASARRPQRRPVSPSTDAEEPVGAGSSRRVQLRID